MEYVWHADIIDRASRRPYWVPDSFSNTCARCQKQFSVLRPKHHCRACGMVFCESCSSESIFLPTFAYFSLQRVCLDCYILYHKHSKDELSGIANNLIDIFPDIKEILT